MKICSVALAYPRFELDFIAEWVDYHLAIGVDRIFLGLHVNEENVVREHLIPPKRPYPRMYHLEGSEGDILSEFHHRIEPFRARVKTFLFRRDDNRYHLHCEQQKELYQLVLDRYRNDFDWVAVHDIDEFIVPVRKPDLKSALLEYGPEVGAARMLQVICEPRWNEVFEPVSEPVLSRHRRMKGVVPHCHGCKTISRFSHTSKLDIHTSIVSGAVVQDDAIRIYHYRGFPGKTEINTGYVLPVEREEFDEIDNRPQALLAQAKAEACISDESSIPNVTFPPATQPERKTLVRVFTFSYRRLNYVCATINALKAQTLSGFVHHLHLLGYTREQAEFVRQVANGDERFVISELENLSQRENLMRILAEMPPDADSYIRMDDDDVYLPTYLQEMYKASLEAGGDLTAFTTLLRHNQRTGDSHLVRESGIYGMTMCLSRRALTHLLSRPNWEHPGFEDSWMDRSMEMPGYKRHITQTEKPLVLYVQHATNVSCADPVAASAADAAPRAGPSSPPDTIIPIRDQESEGEIGLYETGEFILPATGETGNWEVAADGGLILEFRGSGKKAAYSCHEGEGP